MKNNYVAGATDFDSACAILNNKSQSATLKILHIEPYKDTISHLANSEKPTIV